MGSGSGSGVGVGSDVGTGVGTGFKVGIGLEVGTGLEVDACSEAGGWVSTCSEAGALGRVPRGWLCSAVGPAQARGRTAGGAQLESFSTCAFWALRVSGHFSLISYVPPLNILILGYTDIRIT